MKMNKITMDQSKLQSGPNLINQPVIQAKPILVNSEPKVKCSSCKEMFSSTISLFNHFQSVHDGKRFNCSNCGKNFSTTDALTLHIQSAHHVERYKCTKCFKFFSSDVNLRSHVLCTH